MRVDLPQRVVWAQTRARLAVLLFALVAWRCECSDSLGQLPSVGDIEGYVCHPLQDALVSGVLVTGIGPRFEVQAITDAAGYFFLEDLAAGPQTLDVTGAGVAGGDFTDTIDVTVVANEVVRAPDPPCLIPGTGTITGRICATEAGIGSGTGYWLGQARVYVVIGTDVYETTTDADGNFTLSGVPVGTHTLNIDKGSFSASTTVVVEDGSETSVDHVCVAPSTRIGVVTGQFDSVETVLEGMGFGVAGCLPAGAAWCPASLDPLGTVTLIEGTNSAYYATDFLADLIVLQQFDILFFNCGLMDGIYWNAMPGAPQINNLISFVQNGGSIYASDWAYEIIRIAFTNELNFYGADGSGSYYSPDGRVGVLDNALTATIVDTNLEAAVGSATVNLVYNKGDWVPLEVTQPLGVYVWMTGDVGIEPDQNGTADSTWSDAPLLVSKPFGSGRIVYTTFHTHQQVSTDMTEILRYIVFEL